MKMFPDEKYDRSTRKLILLNHNTAMLLNIFKMDIGDDIETIWYDEIVKDWHCHDIHREAAEEFIKQFRDHYCIHFLRCLRDLCDEEVQKWEQENGEKYRELLAKIAEKRKEALGENDSNE